MTRQQIRRTVFGLVALAALLGAAGCGGDRPASVTGHVTYNGRAVTSGTVVFISAEGHSSDPGAVQPDGSYTILHAPAGAVRVVFDNPPPPRTMPPGPMVRRNDPEYEEAAKAAARYVPTPPRYRDPDHSGLACDLKSGRNSYDVVLH